MTIIKHENPDILIGIMPLSFLYLFLANIRYRLPLIAVDHTTFDRKTLPLTNFIRNKLYKYCDVLSILTKKDAKILGNKYPHKVVIYNPLSFPILNEELPRDKTILCAARFDFWKIKGLDILANIWGQLANNYPDWKLQIAGSGNEADTIFVKNMFKKLCPEDSFIFLGQVYDMKSLYMKSSIYVLPSRTEGFPMVLMEAMSQGCACVAFSLGGATNEMMTNEKSGLIVNDKDSNDFKSKLELLMNNDELRNVLSYNARVEVSKFTLENFTNRWMEILNKFM